MEKPVLVIINPISGENRAGKIEKCINFWKDLQDEAVYVYKTTGKDDEKAISQLINEKQISTAIAAGGDGTLLMVAKACSNRDINLGLIPAGSANGMAAELKIPDDPQEALNIIDKGHIKKCDMLLFNEEHLGIHISDLGLNASIVKNFEAAGQRGFFGYTKGFLSEFTKIKQFAVTLHYDGKKESHEVIMAAFANARFYGTGASLNQVGRIDDGKFEVCLLHDISLTKVISHYFDMTGKKSEHLTVRQCDKVTVECSEEIAFQIDGEVMPATKKVEVEIIPGALQLIVP